MKRLSFVIPVYRNERAVSMTYEHIRQVCASGLTNYAYEIVFVDDGSDDGSLQELLAIKSHDPNVQVVSFTRNFGQMAAILAGFKQATGDVIVQLSADLQDPVALVPQMVAEYERGSEVVVCHREHREDGLSSRLTSRALYAILRLSFPQIPAGGFDYILLDRKVVDAFNAVDVRNRFFQGDILWFGYKTTFIPYTRAKRAVGRSQYTFAKRLKNSIDAILDSSYLPIRFISLVGVLTAFVGFLYAIDIVYGRLRHDIPFTGWAPIMILILVIGGLLMLMLGIIGEYVWRIYDEVRGKPNYVVRNIF
jgi:glycosyltransferase involved in cell wall biosynthesis